MLKQFWEEKKHLIQLIGILLAAGALFLSIPIPDNSDAKAALANIQFVWLLIISIALLVLFREFLNLGVMWEKRYGEKYDLNLQDTLSLFIWGTLLFLLFNLWKFISKMYSGSFFSFLSLAGGGLLFAYSAFHYAVWRKLVLKIPEHSSWVKISFSLFAHAIFCLIFGFSIVYLSADNFSLKNSLYTSGLLYFMLLLLICCELLNQRYRDLSLRRGKAT